MISSSEKEKIFWIRESPPERYAETISLSPIAMCAYQRIYWVCYSKQPIIDDDASLARIAGLKLAEWKRVREEVMQHFTVDNSGWYHEGIIQELSVAVDKYRKRSDAGRKGGEAKAKNNKPTTNVDNNKLRQSIPVDFYPLQETIEYAKARRLPVATEQNLIDDFINTNLSTNWQSANWQSEYRKFLSKPNKKTHGGHNGKQSTAKLHAKDNAIAFK